MKCHCGAEFVERSGIGQTLVGYGADEPGHNHDDNCRARTYKCAAGHLTRVHKRNSCPACDWKGKEECFCHEGKKLDAWPEARDVPDLDLRSVR